MHSAPTHKAVKAYPLSTSVRKSGWNRPQMFCPMARAMLLSPIIRPLSSMTGCTNNPTVRSIPWMVIKIMLAKATLNHMPD